MTPCPSRHRWVRVRSWATRGAGTAVRVFARILRHAGTEGSVPGDCLQGEPISLCGDVAPVRFPVRFVWGSGIAHPTESREARAHQAPCSGDATSDARCALGKTAVLIREPYCWQNDTSSARALVNARNSDCARHRAHCWWRALASAMDRRPLSPLRVAPAPEPPSGSNGSTWDVS